MTMPNDINELDVNDIGLKQVMGSRFQDGTENPATAKTEKASTYVPNSNHVFNKHTNEAVEAPWSPFNAEPSFTQKLMNCAKWASLFSSLCLLFFYWQQTGQMKPSAAVPAMLACAVMVGWSFGKYAFKGNRR